MWRRLRRWLAWRLFGDIIEEEYDAAYGIGHVDGAYSALGHTRDYIVRVREDMEREAGLS